jgi:hypothetical protein
LVNQILAGRELRCQFNTGVACGDLISPVADEHVTVHRAQFDELLDRRAPLTLGRA